MYFLKRSLDDKRLSFKTVDSSSGLPHPVVRIVNCTNYEAICIGTIWRMF